MISYYNIIYLTYTLHYHTTSHYFTTVYYIITIISIISYTIINIIKGNII